VTPGEAGEIFYVTFQRNPTPEVKNSIIEAYLYKTTTAGVQILKK
jgi:hypothetical protein